MNIPRKARLSGRNFGFPQSPIIEEREQPAILIIWLISAACGGFMGFMIGLTIGMGWH